MTTRPTTVVISGDDFDVVLCAPGQYAARWRETPERWSVCESTATAAVMRGIMGEDGRNRYLEEYYDRATAKGLNTGD